MKFDFTVTVSVIIALCAIISPIFVAIINHHHQIKIKQLEITKDHKMQAFENYMTCLERCIDIKKHVNLNEYSSAYGRALLYASKSTITIMQEIDSKIRGTSEIVLINVIDESLINKVCVSLQKDMNI